MVIQLVLLAFSQDFPLTSLSVQVIPEVPRAIMLFLFRKFATQSYDFKILPSTNDPFEHPHEESLSWLCGTSDFRFGEQDSMNERAQTLHFLELTLLKPRSITPKPNNSTMSSTQNDNLFCELRSISLNTQ